MQNKKILSYALLADVAYSDFSGLFENKENATDIITNDFFESFAKIITDNYDVVAHWKDNGDLLDIGNFLPFVETNKNKSGFSATLFQDKKSQEYVLAFKGSEDVKDFVISDGADIIFDGFAHEQIIDLYNFWQQLKTPKGETYLAAYYARTLDNVDDNVFELDGGNNYRVLYKPSDQYYDKNSGYAYGLGVLKGDEKISVTGHSLGGHLANIFTQIFNSWVSEAFLFNSAGLGRSESKISNYTKIFKSLRSNFVENDKKITSIIADKGFDFTSNNWSFGLK